MQSVLSRIWTRVAVPISYDANHYTTGTSLINGISPKMNILMQIEFEITVQYVSLYATGTMPT